MFSLDHLVCCAFFQPVAAKDIPMALKVLVLVYNHSHAPGPL